jgi:hypothetical protein
MIDLPTRSGYPLGNNLIRREQMVNHSPVTTTQTQWLTPGRPVPIVSFPLSAAAGYRFPAWVAYRLPVPVRKTEAIGIPVLGLGGEQAEKFKYQSIV